MPAMLHHGLQVPEPESVPVVCCLCSAPAVSVEPQILGLRCYITVCSSQCLSLFLLFAAAAARQLCRWSLQVGACNATSQSAVAGARARRLHSHIHHGCAEEMRGWFAAQGVGTWEVVTAKGEYLIEPSFAWRGGLPALLAGDHGLDVLDLIVAEVAADGVALLPAQNVLQQLHRHPLMLPACDLCPSHQANTWQRNISNKCMLACYRHSATHLAALPHRPQPI